MSSLSDGALANLKISDFDEGEEEIAAFHLSTRIVLENSRDISVHLGPIVFDVTYESSTIAAVVIPDFSMFPGHNEIHLEGVVKPDGLQAFSQLASSFFVDKQYMIGIRGAPKGFSPSPHHSSHPQTFDFDHHRTNSSLASDGAYTTSYLPPSSSSSSSSYSSPRPFSQTAASEAAWLAVRRAGVNTARVPRWLKEVLSRVDFNVPISSGTLLTSSSDSRKDVVLDGTLPPEEEEERRRRREEEGRDSLERRSGGAVTTKQEELIRNMVKKVELVNVDVDFTGPRDPIIGGEVHVAYELPEKFRIKHRVSP